MQVVCEFLSKTENRKMERPCPYGKQSEFSDLQVIWSIYKQHDVSTRKLLQLIDPLTKITLKSIKFLYTNNKYQQTYQEKKPIQTSLKNFVINLRNWRLATKNTLRKIRKKLKKAENEDTSRFHVSIWLIFFIEFLQESSTSLNPSRPNCDAGLHGNEKKISTNESINEGQSDTAK